jgi:UDP-3-O-[3-hydroxymyristoyl] N-acetylglucosamine deacetylase/3-hydroxyacyl-[acyl-carrier-protein] dehydratase
VLELSEPVRVIDGASVYEAFPADALTLESADRLPAPVDRRQAGATLSREAFAPSSRRAHVRLRARGRGAAREGAIRGASTQNAVVLDEAGVVTTLRWPDEFVRTRRWTAWRPALAGRRVRAAWSRTPSHRGHGHARARDARTPPAPASAPARPAPRRRDRPCSGIEEIMKVLPHRYPFLLVDRILEIEEKRGSWG